MFPITDEERNDLKIALLKSDVKSLLLGSERLLQRLGDIEEQYRIWFNSRPEEFRRSQTGVSAQSALTLMDYAEMKIDSVIGTLEVLIEREWSEDFGTRDAQLECIRVRMTIDEADKISEAAEREGLTKDNLVRRALALYFRENGMETEEIQYAG